MKIYLLDNFDSFTYNLVDLFRSLQLEVIIYRNDIDPQYIANNMLSNKNNILVLSPGPGKPSDAGCMPQLLQLLAGKIPILGICLGYQALVEYYGGKIDLAPDIVHGKASAIFHNQKGIFNNLPSPLSMARYHSLIASNIPDTLTITAHIDDLPMAVQHIKDPSVGFQFHPESILTTLGSQLLSQTIAFLSHYSK